MRVTQSLEIDINKTSLFFVSELGEFTISFLPLSFSQSNRQAVSQSMSQSVSKSVSLSSSQSVSRSASLNTSQPTIESDRQKDRKTDRQSAGLSVSQMHGWSVSHTRRVAHTVGK